MIEYQIMDKTNIIPRCLHGGPLHPDTATNSKEIEQYLDECAQKYEAIGILALDEGKVVGLLRFYPDEVFDRLNGQICVHKKVLKSKYNEIDELPNKESLNSRTLKIECMQVVTGHYRSTGKDYGNQGIGRKMIEKMIEWAENNGWDEIKFNGINPYTPLLKFSGLYPKDSLISLGFDVQTIEVDDTLKNRIDDQLSGHHGKQVQSDWNEYDSIDLNVAAEIAHMSLKLQN